MKFNYNKICIAAAIFSAAVACKPDFVDINTSASDTSHMSKMTVRILASGDMISTKTIADKDELTVKDFDIFVFSTTSTGNFLEWFSVGNLPEESSPIEGSCDFLIWSSEISVPTSGTKRIVAVGNSGKGMYPDMTIGKTSFDEFCKAFHFKAFEDKTNKTPFVMSGVTVVASSDGTTVPVRLSRQYNRLDVISGSPSVAITSVQVTKAPSVAYPFLNDYDRQPIPEFISYPVQEAGVPFYILYTPAGDPQWFVNIRVKGTLEGIPFDRTFICENPMYPDYNTVMELGVSDGELIAAYTPDYDSFQTRGAAMSYDIAAWLWTGLFANNDYAQAWASGNPVTSPEGATFTVTDMENPEYAIPVSYSTGTAGQLKNRLRAHSMFTGDSFIWKVPVADAKKGGSLSMVNAMISATQWGPKYYLLEYSLDGQTWTPALNTVTEKSASGSGKDVTYNVKLLKQDDPQPLDFEIELTQTLKDATLQVRLTVSDACCSKEANGDIDATKTAGIAYIHVKNYDTADKDTVFDEDWSSIKFKYTEPKK